MQKAIDEVFYEIKKFVILTPRIRKKVNRRLKEQEKKEQFIPMPNSHHFDSVYKNEEFKLL